MTDKEQIILDACCGSRMFHFDKNNKKVVFMDNRDFEDTLCDGRQLKVHPDIIADFRNIPFEDNTFSLVIFDPPHLLKVGQNSWLCKKYGKLDKTWPVNIKKGFLSLNGDLEDFSICIFSLCALLKLCFSASISCAYRTFLLLRV